MDDERELAIARRERIRKLYNKPRKTADESAPENTEQGRPEDNQAATTKPAASKQLFGGW